MGKLDKRVAVVTGGQRGLGAAMLREFAAEGAVCVVNYPWAQEAETAQNLVRQLEASGATAVAMEADVTRTDTVNAFMTSIRQRFGRLDILVNNAGFNTQKNWENLDRESWDQTVGVNLTGVFNCCRAVLPIMREQKKGNIINISSIAPFLGRGNADYIATKAGIVGLTSSLARQYGKDGIRANAISPGMHNTEMTQQGRSAAESVDEFIKQIPLGFVAEPDSIAKAALFLASDDSHYITGHNLVVDGGLTLR